MTKTIIFVITIAITLFAAGFLAVTIPTVQANHPSGESFPECRFLEVWDPNVNECIPSEECEFGVDTSGPRGEDHCNSPPSEPSEDCTGERIAETVTFHDNYKINKLHDAPGTAMVLLDTTGSGFLCVVHVAANLPCNNDNPPIPGAGNDTPDVVILAGIAGGSLSPVIFSIAEDTGFRGPDETCVFHATVTAAGLGHDITDIIVLNSGVDDVELDASVITITGRMTDESVVPPPLPEGPGTLSCTCEPKILQESICLEDCNANKDQFCTELCEADDNEFVSAECIIPGKICEI